MYNFSYISKGQYASECPYEMNPHYAGINEDGYELEHVDKSYKVKE